MESPRQVKGRPIKYESPASAGNVLDLNPMMKGEAGNPASLLWIVEGIKKADALVSQGEVAVAIAGVWSWRGTNAKGGKTALAEFDDLALNGREVAVCFDSDVLEKKQVRAAMVRLVEYLRARGADARYVVVPATADGAKRGADDFLAEEGNTVAGLLSFAAEDLPEASTKAALPGYEEVVAQLDGFRFVVDWGKWIRWTGRAWQTDTKEQVYIHGAILAIIDPDKSRVTATKYCSLDEMRKIRQTMETDEPQFHVTADMLDARPHLLNVANGTVDLRSGVLSPHDPEQLLTRITKGEYHPGRRDRDIDALTRDTVPEDCRDFLQRVFGFACFGDVREELFLVLTGMGANGKTSLLSAANAALGDYASAVNIKLIMGHSNEHSTIEADLFGKRLVYLSETPDGGELALERVKALTGGDIRRARRMREDYWQFVPSHTLLLATNHLPVVGSTDFGTWRRIRCIPFPYRFVAEQDVKGKFDRVGDSNIRMRAIREQSAFDAFVAWAVEGAVAYTEKGLRDVPSSSQAVTDVWRTESDPFGTFLRERCVVEQSAKVEQSAFTRAFNEWLVSTTVVRIPTKTTTWVKAQLRSLGSELGFEIEESKSHGSRYLNGVRLAEDGEQPRITHTGPPNEEAAQDNWWSDLLRESPEIVESMRKAQGDDV
jgi:P4 family phage/plasmid primase-like protien